MFKKRGKEEREKKKRMKERKRSQILSPYC